MDEYYGDHPAIERPDMPGVAVEQFLQAQLAQAEGGPQAEGVPQAVVPSTATGAGSGPMDTDEEMVDAPLPGGGFDGDAFPLDEWALPDLNVYDGEAFDDGVLSTGLWPDEQERLYWAQFGGRGLRAPRKTAVPSLASVPEGEAALGAALAVGEGEHRRWVRRVVDESLPAANTSEPAVSDVAKAGVEKGKPAWEQYGRWGAHAPAKVKTNNLPRLPSLTPEPPYAVSQKDRDEWGRFVDRLLDAGEREGADKLAAELTAAAIRFQELVESDQLKEIEAKAKEIVGSWRDLLGLVAKAQRFGKVGSLEELKAYHRDSTDRQLATRKGEPIMASQIHAGTRKSPDGRFQGRFSFPRRGGLTMNESDRTFLAEVDRFFSELDTSELPFKDAVFVGINSIRKPALAGKDDGNPVRLGYRAVIEYFWETISRKDHVFVFTSNLTKPENAAADPLKELLPGLQLTNTLGRWVWGVPEGGVPQSAADLVAFRPEPAKSELEQLARQTLGTKAAWRTIRMWVRALRLLFGPELEVQSEVFKDLLHRFRMLGQRRRQRVGGEDDLTWDALVAEVWGDKVPPSRPEWRVGVFREALKETLRRAAPGPFEMPRARYSVDLFSLVGPNELMSGAGDETERLLLWAYPALSGNPEAQLEYTKAMEALEEWRQSRHGDGFLTVEYLRDLVGVHTAEWGVPDMEFGEGLRRVLEAQRGVGAGLGRFEVESDQDRWDQAAAPALFRSAGPDAGVSVRVMRLIRALGAEVHTKAEYRELVRGAEVLGRFIGGDPLAEVDGVRRVDAVARRVLGLGADKPVVPDLYRTLLRDLARADRAGRAGSLSAASTYRTAGWLGGTPLANSGIGRNGTRARYLLDLTQFQVQKGGTELGKPQPAPWGRGAPVDPIRLRVNETHVVWYASGTRYEISWAEWVEGLKHDPLRLAGVPVVLLLNSEEPWHHEFAQLVADTLGVTVYFDHAPLKGDSANEQIPIVRRGYRQVEPRIAPPLVGSSVRSVWGRAGLKDGVEALRLLRERAGDVRGLTWAGV
ncbi:hypothetical protein, partial [Streptomyces sp. NPDC048527]|uniref:hypothetical protein n=1 Tax=Streptomyces sp. NPDC048527 TaxID=3365568 RepID=UPI0037177D4F